MRPPSLAASSIFRTQSAARVRLTEAVLDRVASRAAVACPGAPVRGGVAAVIVVKTASKSRASAIMTRLKVGLGLVVAGTRLIVGLHPLAADNAAVLILDAVLGDGDVHGAGTSETAQEGEGEKKATHCCCSPVGRERALRHYGTPRRMNAAKT
jgi:hypothetical protein